MNVSLSFLIDILIFLIPELDTTVKEASANDDSCLEDTISEEKSSEGWKMKCFFDIAFCLDLA